MVFEDHVCGGAEGARSLIVRIVHVIYDDVGNPWLGGGGAARALAVNRRLLDKGAEITMICGNFPARGDAQRYDGLTVLRPGSDRSYLRSRLSFARGAEELLGTMDYDLLVHDASAFHPIESDSSHRAATVGIVHHILGRALFHKFAVLGLLPYWWERQIIGAFTNIITVSEPVREHIRKGYNSTASIDVIPNGVDPELLEVEPVETDAILFLGRLDIYQKGIDVLLGAFARLGETRAGITLIMAGSGKDEHKVRVAVERLGLQERVRFEGRVDGAAKIECLRSCLFCVMPSRYEGWPVVAIEAGACGKPVIGTRIDGFRDAVLEDDTGLLATPDDAESLVTCMERLLDDEAMRRRLGANGRARARAFTWDQITDRQWAVYQRVVGMRSG